MDKLLIERHNFENAKNEIEKFSKMAKTEVSLKTVDDTKEASEFFWDFICGRGVGLNHTVTGEELNELTAQIQSHLVKINENQIKTIDAFGEIYRALDGLDKDYIEKIIFAVNMALETSQGVQKAQDKIGKIVENQRKTLEILKNFKEKLDGYDHLCDIDKIWSDYQDYYQIICDLPESINTIRKENAKSFEDVKLVLKKAQEEIKKLSADIQQNKKEAGRQLIDAIRAVDKEIETLAGQSENQRKKLEEIIDFVRIMRQISHLNDVDNMWNKVEIHTSQIEENREKAGKLAEAIQQNKKEVSQQLTNAIRTVDKEIETLAGQSENQRKKLEEIIDFVRIMRQISHLSDVDNMWNKVEAHTVQLQENRKQDESMAAAIQKNKEETAEKLTNAVKMVDNDIILLKKRIKYAYFIAGSAVGLAIIELALLLIKGL